MSVLLKGGLVFLEGTLQKLDVLIAGDDVADIAPSFPLEQLHGATVIDCAGKIISPGFVDVHVHLREPGFSMKETIAKGTAAAAKSGYTAICAMPNLNPVPDCAANLQQELDIIARDAVIPVHAYAAITVGQKGEQLVDFAALRQAIGFSDDGRGVQSREMMKQAMLEIKAASKILAAHCEDDSLNNGGVIHDGDYAKIHGLPGIPSESEWRPIARDIELVRETGCHYHVCHVSAKESVEVIRRAKAAGVPITCETAPHYLALCDEDLLDEGRFKMNPPIRGREDRDALISGLIDGTIDMIATDHAPHTAEEKSKGLLNSIMGITGLETAFPVLYTILVKSGKMSLERLLDVMSAVPGEVFGLGGKIQKNARADIAVLDVDGEYEIDPLAFLSKGKSTPFTGMKVRGECVLTICSGKIVWSKEGGIAR